MKILAIDPGTRCGYADNYTREGSGVWNFTPKKGEGKGIRYLRFENEFTAHAAIGAELVVYEEVRRHRGTAAAHVYGGLIATLTKQCEKMGIRYVPVPVGTWKKVVVGKGNATPDSYRKFAQVQFKMHDPKNYDEAAALCMLEWAKREFLEDPMFS